VTTLLLDADVWQPDSWPLTINNRSTTKMNHSTNLITCKNTSEHLFLVIGQKSGDGRLLCKGQMALATYWGASSQSSTGLQ
jgi:hypothetical protein